MVLLTSFFCVLLATIVEETSLWKLTSASAKIYRNFSDKLEFNRGNLCLLEEEV